MNQRIRELIEEAGMTLKPRRPHDASHPNGYMESDDSYFYYNLEAVRVFFEGGSEKLAELIVRECADVVFKKTGPKSALNVLEHFGLKE